MATTYRRDPEGGIIRETTDLSSIPPAILWIDAIDPTDEELERLDAIMGFEVPNRHDITDIELSSRLYKEPGALVMIANLLPKSRHRTPRPAAFVLKEHILLTIRFNEFLSFDRVSKRPSPDADQKDLTAVALFCRLLEEAVADRADNLELSMRYMEELTSRLFIAAPTGQKDAISESPELDVALKQIGRMGESVSNIRESITSMQRAVNYAYTYIPDHWMRDQRYVLESIRSDLVALSDEAAFFMNKLSFNLDATLGMINIDESQIIRLLSVVTLLLSPPTLIAGIYGMNFTIMPELNWQWGYAFALGLMATTAVVSVLYLKKKRWL